MKIRIMMALLVAAAVNLPGEKISAQARLPRVEITSGARTEPLRPPRTPATDTRMAMMASAAYDVQRWTDRSFAPATLPPARLGTFAIAGDLLLQKIQYKIEGQTLVLVADKLRIGSNATIDVSSYGRGGSAGKVILLANEIICESGGTLRIIADGLGVSTNGGQVLVGGSSQPAVAPGVLPPCIIATVSGAPVRTVTERDHRRRAETPAAGTVIIRDHRGGRVTTTTRPAPTPPAEVTKTYPAGAAGRITASPYIRAITASEELAQTVWSMWAVERLETLRISIYDASRRGDRQRIVSLFREYEAFNPSSQMISADMREKYLAVIADLQTYRQNAMPPLWVEELTVRPGGLSQPVTTFTEGATFRTTLAPTHTLASPTKIDGRSVLGLIDYRSERPDEIAIEVECELSIDPWMEQLATEQLKKNGQKLDGVFNGWALEAKPMQEIGVRTATATLLPGGRRLRMRLTADAERANLVFWRLLNSAGLPWTVDWKFTEPGSGRVVTGTWAGPPLTLVRQRDPQVKVEDGYLVNKGSRPLVVNYVRKKGGMFVALNPAIRLAAGERVQLPPVAGVGGVSAIPPEAVESVFDLDTFSTDFYVLNGAQLVDKIAIRNLLPTSDDQRGAFDRLEITVKAGIEGDNPANMATAGPFVLSAAGTRAGEISIPFLHLARGQRQVSIEGRAYYAGGSYRTLKPTTFDTLSIAITTEMFQ
jgi:hypothetical protein